MADPLTPDPSLGVFETMLVADDEPVELAAHLDRLRSSVADLYAATLPEEARETTLAAARGLVRGRLRLVAKPSSREGTEIGIEVKASAIDAAIICPDWEHGQKLVARTVAGWRGAHKWADRRLLEALEAEAGPAAPLLVDEDGAVLETTRANVFMARSDGSLATPPADGRPLPGIARARAIEVAREAGLEVIETEIGLADLATASEVFLTGSVRGVEPVRSVDGAPVAERHPPLTERIATGLRRRWLG